MAGLPHMFINAFPGNLVEDNLTGMNAAVFIKSINFIHI
jgi:hypothetical protein